VLPRVSAALSRFIQPVSSSAERESVRAKEKEEGQEFQRFNPHSRKKPQAPQEPLSDEEKKDPLPPPSLRLAERPSRPQGGVTAAFLDIFRTLRSQRQSLVRWLGHRSYGNQKQASAATERPGRLKKGAILDQKAE